MDDFCVLISILLTSQKVKCFEMENINHYDSNKGQKL